MLESFLWILGMGFFGGQIARRLGAPALVGMVLIGIVLGPSVAHVLSPDLLAGAAPLRTVAVMVILMKAGLGLDRDKLAQQGTVALRLGFLPALGETLVVAIAAHWLFGLDWPTGLLLGCVLAPESPAVIVPGMLRLKSLGWGVTKGIPDAILTGSALSDVLMLLGFSLLLRFLAQGSAGTLAIAGFQVSAWVALPLQVLSQIGFGVGVGLLAARSLVSLLSRQNWTQNAVQDILLAACAALLLVVGAERLPFYSGYLAVMAMGFFLIEFDAPLARRLRTGFDGLWVIAEILLFGLLGASIEVSVLESVLLPGLLLLAVGTLVGRSLGWWLSTAGSNWTWQERLFLLPGNSAKATVQAAIGAIPLAQGLAGGEVVLALAALSILVTAPLGAWAIPTFAPRLLSRGAVDPTKVSVARQVVIVAAVDTSPLAAAVLTKAAELARRSDGTVLVVSVVRGAEAAIAPLQALTRQTLADIRHEFCPLSGSVPETIIEFAIARQAAEIVLGKRGHQAWDRVLVGSVSQAVLEASPIPVLLVEDEASGRSPEAS